MPAPAAQQARATQPPAEEAFDAFDRWAKQYVQDPAADAIEEGTRLAAARRQVLLEEIQRNPRLALRHAVSYGLRRQLPGAVATYLEEVVSGRGNLEVYCAVALPGADHREFAGSQVRYVTLLDSRTVYRAFVYGSRVRQMTTRGIAVQGIAIDRYLALSENPTRRLDAAEVPDLMARGKAATSSGCALCGVGSAAGERWLEYAGQLLRVCSDAHAGELNRALAAAEPKSTVGLHGGPVDNPIWSTPPPASPQGSFGPKKVLYMPLVFIDDPAVQISQSEAEATMHEVNDYYVEASYEKTSLITTVTPVLTLPYPKLDYSAEGPGMILSDAAAQALLAGYDAAQYDIVVMRHPNVPGFEWAGLGGGGVTWLQSSGSGVLIHELGHVYGLGHANFWDTRRPGLPGADNPADADGLIGHDSVIGVGDDVEYGDIFDIMGSGGGESAGSSTQISTVEAHFNAIGKAILGWLPLANLSEATQLSTNRVYVHDVPRLVDGRSYGLRVAKDYQRTYWVSARSKITGNEWSASGVELHWGPWQQGIGYSDLLDTTPGTKSGRQDAAILLGRTFADEESEVYITPVARGGTGTNLWYDVVVSVGVATNNEPPVVTLSASTNAVRAGGQVTFTATAYDTNRNALSYYWESSDGMVVTNTSSVFTRAFSEAGEYVIRCEVSDLRGGMTSKHVVVSVGTITTLRIAGRVVDPTGNPVQRVRVSNGSITEARDLADDYQWTYTDADGAFTLVNLTNGQSYAIGAFLNGSITKPLNFTPPIALSGQDADGVLFLAVPRVQVRAVTTTDADVAAGTPGAFTLTRTGDTNTAIQALFLLSGSAAAGDDFDDWTNIVTHTNVVQTPFGPNESTYDFYVADFPTGVFETNITILPKPTAAGKTVALTLMYPLALMQTWLTNGETEGLLVTNTNWVSYAAWELLDVNGTETWFQNYSDYVPGYPSEAIMELRGAPGLPIVSVAAFSPNVMEMGGDAGTFLIYRSGSNQTALTVSYTLEGTATAGSDYEALPLTATIPAGEVYVKVPVVARQDAFLEGNETVVLILSEDASKYSIGTADATVTIGDNDLPLVVINATDGIATEIGGDTGTFVVTRHGDLTQALMVNYLVTGTAISGTDYRALSGTVTIPAGQPSVSILLTPRDNGLRDNGRTVEVFLSDSPAYNIGTPRIATVLIQDRNLPTVTIAATVAAAAEPGTAGEITVTRTGGDQTKELIVRLEVGGNAKPLADVAPIASRIRIPPSVSQVVFSVTPINDGFREDPEYVVVTVAKSSDYLLGTPSQAKVNLTDDDGSALPAVGFDTLTSSVAEDAGVHFIPITITGNPAEDLPVTLLYKVTGGTALPDVDYPSLSQTGYVIFPHNPNGGADEFTNRTQLIPFPINANIEVQSDRTVAMTLLPPPSWTSNWLSTNEITITNGEEVITTNEVVTNYIIIDIPVNAQFDIYKSHTFTILDDDNCILNVEASEPVAYEEGLTPGAFLIRRGGSTNRAQTFTVQVVGSANNGGDFQFITNVFVIPAGVAEFLIPVMPVDDPTQEFMEQVRLIVLTAPGAQLGETTASVDIVDNDGTIEFTQTRYQTLEDVGVAAIPVRRTSNTNETSMVEYSVTALTATADADFVYTNGTLVFEPGQTVANLPVTILDDVTVESLETIQLTLLRQSGGAPLGGQTTATLTIEDQDSSVEFARAAYRVNENGTNASITLRRLGVVDREIQVDFAATNDTAAAGVEFVATNLTLTFKAGETSQVARVRILDNALIESNKTVLLTLAATANATAGAGPLTNALLEIVSDDCALEFTTMDYQVHEFARSVALEVRRVGGTVNPVSVSYATTNGTALAGEDYAAAQGTVSFAGDTYVLATDGSGTMEFLAGESVKTIDVSILDNNNGEGNRQFIVGLRSPRGPTTGVVAGSTILGTNLPAAVTILDDEMPGGVDGTFNPGLGANAPVNAVAVQPDKKMVIGGEFTEFDGVVLNHIARLHEDGYLDSYFNPGSGPDGVVHAIAVQSDGHILIGGAFTQYGAKAAKRLARLNADGTLDSSFDVGLGADGIVRALAVTTDGGILVGGDFLTINGVSRPGIAKLTRTGDIDTSFAPDAGAPGGVYAVAGLADGKVLIGGQFTSAGGASYASVARFQAGGAIDRTFTTGVGPDGPVYALAVDSEGRALLGGGFSQFNNVARPGVARLTADGALDTSFDPGTGADDLVYGLAVQQDGKVMLAGAFTTLTGVQRNRYGRLNSNGSLDTGFEVYEGANGTVRSLAMQSDTAFVIGGEFTQCNGQDRARVARIHGDEKFVLNLIQFSAASYRVAEGGGKVEIPVIRSGDIDVAAQITAFTVDSSAKAGEDYAATNVTVRFEAGEVQKTFAVVILDDSVGEGDEFFVVGLTNIPSGFSASGQTAASVLIADDESAIAFSQAAYGVDENGGSATILVRRTGPTAGTVTVDYAARAGTAQADIDFVPTAGTLSFGSGESEKSFEIVILDNDQSDPDRSVLLELTNPTGGGVLGSQSTATLAIVDNDAVEFYTLKIATPVGGSVSPASGPYAVGSTQVLTASADRDFVFTGWTGTTNSAANPLILTMDRDYDLTANFMVTKTTYTFELPFAASDLRMSPWANASTVPWELSSATASDSIYSVRSGGVGNGRDTLLELVVDTRAGAMSFDLRVSSEADWDFLEFYINGVRMQRWSGELPWQNVRFQVGAGHNTLGWRYVKDANFSTGLDAAFIDNLYVPVTSVDPVDPAAHLAVSVLTGNLLNIELSGKSGSTYVLQWSTDLVDWTSSSTHVLQGTTLFLQEPISPAQPARFYRAVVP